MFILIKKLFIGILCLAMFFSILSISVLAGEESLEPVELIKNGSVKQGTDYWGIYVESPGKGSLKTKNEEIIYDIQNVGTNSWHIQGTYAGLRIIEGNRYRISFDMRASAPRKAEIRLQKDAAPYTGYASKEISLTEKMQHFTIEFKMKEPTDPIAKLCFNIGKVGEVDKLSAHKVYVDNLSLLDLSGGGGRKLKRDTVHLNQVGYRPDDSKLLIVAGEAEMYEVKNSNGDVVFSSTFVKAGKDEASGDLISYGEFLPVTQEGEYTVSVIGHGESYPFEIKENVYSDVHNALLKMFFYQRCGSELSEKHAGKWAHEACHAETATYYSSDGEKEVSGGWHDAGDYGRYVVPGAKAVADLLLTYQFYEDNIDTDSVGISESGNGIPDILDEVRYEMEWMLKMQDKNTGGVYHKVTTANFQGNKFPDEISAKLILSPISATATADFAAVTAMTSRIYKTIDPVFANKCLEAAEKAWSWLKVNQNVPGFKNPVGIKTGEYGDDEDGDERYWAATELYLTTGKQNYHQYTKESYNENKWEGLGWADVGDYANISYLFVGNDEIIDKEFAAKLKKSFLFHARELLDMRREDGYNISLRSGDYNWGSNMTVANNGMYLLIASKLEESGKQYKTAAQDHLHYLLGRNPLSQSYITGFGEKFTKHSHHRLSEAAGDIVPGMVAGGPNANLQDPLAKSQLVDKAPAKTYIDAVPSYSTNEITIYWNSPVVFLFSAFSDLD